MHLEEFSSDLSEDFYRISQTPEDHHLAARTPGVNANMDFLGSSTFAVLESNQCLDSPDFASNGNSDWDQVIFSYPGTPGGGSSAGSETNVWSTSNFGLNDESLNHSRLPSVESAFSFSRNFAGNVYPDYYRDYGELGQEPEDPVLIRNSWHATPGAEDFDLSLIRADPNALPRETGSLSSTLDDNMKDCYSVGHLVSSKYVKNENCQNYNQVVLPRNESLHLSEKKEVARYALGVRSVKKERRDEESNVNEDLLNSSYQCLWVDCGCVFTEQEGLVRHIERRHVESSSSNAHSRRIQRDKDKEKDAAFTPGSISSTGQDEFACLWKGCPRARPFNARYKLLIHMRVHSGEKPNKCPFSGCKKAFSRLENLKIHQRSHTGERPYACQHRGCTKAFSNSSDRAKHQRTHYDTKPYACQFNGCGKRYTDPSSLRKHVKNHAEPTVQVLTNSTNSTNSNSFEKCNEKIPASLSINCSTIIPQKDVTIAADIKSKVSLSCSENGDFIGTNSYDIERLSMNLEDLHHQQQPQLSQEQQQQQQQPEFIPFESVGRFLLDNESEFNTTGYNDDVTDIQDIQELGSDIEQQLLELSNLNNDIFDG